MAISTPVFYDCEASDLEGYPIEIGWAFADPATGVVASESHLIKPAEGWLVRESWDRAAERLHGITLAQLWRDGRPARDVAQRMNAVLDGRELFSDAPQDERWLRLLFDAAGVEPSFTIRRTDARILISQAAGERGLDEAAFSRAKVRAAEMAPRRHRAEADARHLAVLWTIVARGASAP
ncbi:MAG TPA: hypothetical protein VFN77_10110 [Acetobacteraceae bacterium]|nr:hypothetical protein [Acetobacteraceae bacterium]